MFEKYPVRLSQGHMTVDNPGKGHCGFYAFAIGLVPYLQEDIDADNKGQEQPHRLLEKLEEKAKCNAIKLDWGPLRANIQQFNLLAPKQYEKTVLGPMNVLLRAILFNKRQTEISNIKTMLEDQSYGKLEQDSLYASIQQAFQEVLGGKLKTVDFSKNIHFQQAVRDFTAKLKKEKEGDKRKDRPTNVAQSNDSTGTVYSKEAIPRFVQKDLSDESQSSIFKVIQSKKDSNSWATFDDLNTLSNELNCQLQIYQNGQSIPMGNSSTNRQSNPVIALHNKDNVHWTTGFSVNPSCESGPSATTGQTNQSNPKMPTPNKEEVINILEQYTQGKGWLGWFKRLLSFKWNHHHIQRCQRIIDQINHLDLVDRRKDQTMSTDWLFLIIENGISPDLNSKGDFAKHLGYIYNRYNRWLPSWATEQNKNEHGSEEKSSSPGIVFQ